MAIVEILVVYFMVGTLVFVVSDSAQRFFYDQVTDGLAWRSAAAAVPLALLLRTFPLKFDEMFIDMNFVWTMLQASAWFVAFWLIVRFQAPHAALVGIVSFFMFSLLVSLALDSLRTRFGIAPPALPPTPVTTTTLS